MSLSYELAKKLKDAGFPQANKDYKGIYLFSKPEGMGESVYCPPLPELIEACGDRFKRLETCKVPDIITNIEKTVWFAYSEDDETTGYTPDEAISNLWLELNKKI